MCPDKTSWELCWARLAMAQPLNNMLSEKLSLTCGQVCLQACMWTGTCDLSLWTRLCMSALSSACPHRPIFVKYCHQICRHWHLQTFAFAIQPLCKLLCVSGHSHLNQDPFWDCVPSDSHMLALASPTCAISSSLIPVVHRVASTSEAGMSQPPASSCTQPCTSKLGSNQPCAKAFSQHDLGKRNLAVHIKTKAPAFGMLVLHRRVTKVLAMHSSGSNVVYGCPHACGVSHAHQSSWALPPHCHAGMSAVSSHCPNWCELLPSHHPSSRRFGQQPGLKAPCLAPR